jgi:hypothetical protein
MHSKDDTKYATLNQICVVFDHPPYEWQQLENIVAVNRVFLWPVYPQRGEYEGPDEGVCQGRKVYLFSEWVRT